MSKAIYLKVQQDPTFKEPATVVAKKTAASRKPAAAAATEELTATDFIADLRTFLDEWTEAHGLPPFEGSAKATPSAKEKVTAAKAAAKKAEPEEDEDEGSERRAELEKMTIAALRKLAIQRGFGKDDVADATKSDLVESILDDELNSDDDADEAEAEEEDEDEEDDNYTRADLEKLNLRAIQKIAREEYELAAADYKGMDKDALIAYLLGEDEDAEDETDEDEDEDEESEDETEEDEEEGYTEEDLAEMSLADLKGIAKEYGVTVRPGMKALAIRKAILAAQDEE